ncbi:YybS family protein [Ornithinibacillus californiensis]|uniref:YybS family protein n=1 Tax=Ornithinibacillus californiensis TaxID=161536 RepID=UPI00064E1444|nr:YybS family protein [Ornithinibacillus californiensis]
MNKSKQLTDGALFTLVFIGMLLASVYLPVLSFFTVLVLAVPFIIYSAKHDWKPALVMLAVSILLSVLVATIISVPLTIFAGLGGIMIGSAIHKELTPYETWARGTLGYVAGILFALVFAFLAFNVNILNEFNQQMDQILEMSKQMTIDLGMGEVSEEDLAIVEQQVNLYKQLYPVFIVFTALLLALLNQWIGYKIVNRMEKKQLRFPKFRNLKFPKSILWIYLFAIIFSLFQNDPNGTVLIALQNVMMLTGLLMAIQGLSFVFFVTHHKNKSIAIPIIVVVLTVIFAPLLLPLIRILGIIDLGFGLRERMVQ